MSLSTSVSELRISLDDLRMSLAELVMTAREDVPDSADVAAADSVAELVTELQGAIEQASARLSTITDGLGLPAVLPPIAEDLASVELRYWRDLRSFPAISALRLAVRGRSAGWRSWQRGVELSAKRCEEPLGCAGTAVRAAGAEVAEILTLYLPRGQGVEPDPAPSEPISSRRS